MPTRPLGEDLHWRIVWLRLFLGHIFRFQMPRFFEIGVYCKNGTKQIKKCKQSAKSAKHRFSHPDFIAHRQRAHVSVLEMLKTD